MYRRNQFQKDLYKTGEVAKILGVTPQTVINYDKAGKLPIKRTSTNRRVIYKEDLFTYLDNVGLLEHENTDKVDVIYARVSSQDQKQHGDLDRQALFLIENVKDLQNPVVLKEVESGLNDKRTQLNNLIKMVMEDKVNRVYVTYKDRLTRFGFSYLQMIFKYKGVDIITVKDTDTEKSVHDELVEDMMSLVESFSSKLYGLRSGRNKRKEQRCNDGDKKSD
jgi:predicted site-specific integrase-resolvase